jgi:hypothetical protein
MSNNQYLQENIELYVQATPEVWPAPLVHQSKKSYYPLNASISQIIIVNNYI